MITPKSPLIVTSSSKIRFSTVPLQVLRDSNDGFVIAQKDLEIRGPGELLGTVSYTHLDVYKRQAVGRRLDFMMQEFNRESNTLASKSINAEVTNSAIELKVLILSLIHI